MVAFNPVREVRRVLRKNAIHPRPGIGGAQLERRDPSQSLGVGFLDQAFGFFAILGAPVGEIIELIEERHRQFFE